MKLLADESIPRASLRELRLAGWHVVSTAETAPGLRDAALLRLARDEGRVLVSFYRHYGALIFRGGAACPRGLVWLRFTPLHPNEPAEVLLRLLAREPAKVEGRYVILERDHLRGRALPQAG